MSVSECVWVFGHKFYTQSVYKASRKAEEGLKRSSHIHKIPGKRKKCRKIEPFETATLSIAENGIVQMVKTIDNRAIRSLVVVDNN